MTLAAFQARLDLCRQAWNTVEEHKQQAALDRGVRNDTQSMIYPILKVYRLKFEALFPEGRRSR